MASNENQPHTIVLAIDGLRAAALGAYGATAYETPGFDALAAEAETHDWCYADSPDNEALSEALAERLRRTITEPSLYVADQADSLDSPLAGLFDERCSADAPEPTQPADSIAETALTAAMSGFAAELAERVGRLNEGERLFAWLHTTGLYGPWDAPAELADALRDEEDPELDPSVAAPDAFFTDNGSPEACEARFAASCRYAGQILALDACLIGWLDVIESLFEGETLRLVVLGWRGFPLGEHGRVGGVDRRLYSEQQQTPLLVRHADGVRRFVREARPAKLSDALAVALGGPPADDDRPVVLTSQDGSATVLHDGWLLRRPGADENKHAEELYLKPDDRWEQNDVASLEPGVVEELAEQLRGR